MACGRRQWHPHCPYDQRGSAVTEPPDEPDGRPGDDDEDSGAEDSRTAGDGPESLDGEDSGDGEDQIPRPYAFSPLANIDLSSILNIGKFSELILSHAPDMSKLMPDVSHLFPPSTMLPLARFEELVLPALRISELAPKIDYASFFPKIELPDFTSHITRSLPPLPPLSPALMAMLERLRESLPPNWPSDIDIENVTTIVQDDGLPLVWVPRAAIVTELLAAPDRAARIDILLSHTDELAEDCRTVLGDVSHESLSGQLPLAVKALDAYEEGHYEAAQALAVTITETAVARALGNKYAEVKQKVLFDPEFVRFTDMRLRAALAPIGPFYTTWYASSGTPVPAALSRHVTVHQADRQHYTRGNATVAVLLVTSVLRALQELQELAEASEET